MNRRIGERGIRIILITGCLGGVGRNDNSRPEDVTQQWWHGGSPRVELLIIEPVFNFTDAIPPEALLEGKKKKDDRISRGQGSPMMDHSGLN